MARKPTRYDTTLPFMIEAATELLRRVDVRAWAWWFGGTLPFVGLLIHFWTDMSRGAHAEGRLAQSSLLLAVGYTWMKIAQSVFADCLLRHLRGEGEPPPMSLRSKLRFASSQMMIHCTMPWVLVLAALAMVPFKWAFAFYHNVSVLALSHFRAGGRTRDLLRTALVQTHFRWGQSFGMLLMLFIVSGMVWMNLMMGTLQGGIILRMFTGEDNEFTRNPWSLLSSTMFAATIAMAYVLVGPLVKSVYALRCFHGLSRKNGEDLLVAFRRTIAALLLMACFMPGATARAEAAAKTEVVASTKLDPTTLDRSIREVLSQDEFQWRMPRDKTKTEQHGWLSGFFDTVSQWFKAVMKSFNEWVDKYLVQKLKEWLRGTNEDQLDKLGKSTPWADAAQPILKVLLAVLGGALLVLLIRQWLRAPPAPAKAVDVVPEINLENEQVIASQLPENEWLKLAQEKIDSGDYRLALRALFLATLSHLGERRLLAIARSKSNGDYVRELAMRARDREELRTHFLENVRRFDWAWYGWHDVTRDLLDEFRSNHQHIVSDGTPR